MDAPTLHILYFAWVKDRLGCGEEWVSVPPDVGDIAALRRWIQGRGPLHEAVFGEGASIRAAVNQEFAGDHVAIGPGDEIAFFPPVTGG